MNPKEQDRLLREILQDEESADFRAASLDSGLACLRRQRRIRQWQMSAAAIVPILMAACLLVLTKKPVVSPPPRPVAMTHPVAENSVKIISDDDLFALFPGRAMALIGPRGRQELVFLDKGGGSSQESDSR